MPSPRSATRFRLGCREEFWGERGRVGPGEVCARTHGLLIECIRVQHSIR